MDTNAVADELAAYLETKHARVYRNKAKQSPVLPYVVYRIDTISNVALYTSAWIEIVETQLADINSNVSHSTRVRGLK